MSFKKFIPELESKNIEHGLQKFLTLASDCNTMYEGELKKGQTVSILGVGTPNIGDYDGTAISPAEEVKGFTESIMIDAQKYFNYQIDDIDKAYNKNGLMEAYSEETQRAMASVRDAYIAEKCGKAADDKTVTVIPVTITKYEDLAKALSQAKVMLRDNCVSPDIPVTAYLSPAAYDLIADYLINKGTSNNEAIASGEIARFKSMKVKESNNLYVNGGYTYAIVKTKRAFGFASGLKEVEAYRPHDGFKDAVKGLDVFGGGVVRPTEMVIIKYKINIA